MNALFFHPKLVHVPMALGALMPLIAAGLLLAWWRSWLPSRAWLIALGLQAVLLVSGLVALSSGEAEEERVERVVAEAAIEAHEEAAELFVAGSGAVLSMMLAAAVLHRRRSGLLAASLATVGTLVVFTLGYRTGHAGGGLVYQHGAAQAYAPVGNRARVADAPRGDDDD